MYLFLFLNKIMFSNSILDGLFNIPQYESKRKPMFNDLDSIFKKEENTRPSIYKKDEIKGSAKKDIKQELPKKNMFEPKCGNSLTVLRDEFNKYNDFIYKNEVLIEQLKEENESAKKIQEQLSKKIKELEQDVTAIIKDFADCYVKKGGLKIYADELLRLYDVIKNTKDVHIDIVRLEKGYDLIIELGKEIDTTNIKLFKGIFKFMNEFMM